MPCTVQTFCVKNTHILTTKCKSLNYPVSLGMESKAFSLAQPCGPIFLAPCNWLMHYKLHFEMSTSELIMGMIIPNYPYTSPPVFWKCHLIFMYLVHEGTCINIRLYSNILEPPDDKTNKMACAPSENSDQPGHPPSLTRVFAVCMKKAWVLSYPLSTQRRLWSDWADAQADLSLRWVHSHFVGFVMRWLIFVMVFQLNVLLTTNFSSLSFCQTDCIPPAIASYPWICLQINLFLTTV